MIALPNFVIPYMFETPKASVLEQEIIAQTAAQAHYPPALVARFVHFQGDLSYAAGFSVFQPARHIIIFTSLAGMIFAPVGGIIARRVGARLPMIIGSISLLAAFLLWWQFHITWQQQAAIGILFGLGFGFYYAASPNLLIGVVAGAVTVALALLLLRSGRTPARGGAAVAAPEPASAAVEA